MEEVLEIKTDEEKEIEKLRELLQNTRWENRMLKQQLDQVKMINEDQEKTIADKEEIHIQLSEGMKEALNKIEILSKELEKIELLERMTCPKDVSFFHCELCKENETEYEYCPQSIINFYKALYLNEETIRKEKEKELEEYNLLFQTYSEQETERNEEQVIKNREIFEQILEELENPSNLPTEEVTPKLDESINTQQLPEQKD